MLGELSIIITIIPFLVGIIGLWGIDEFEELTLNYKDRMYKKILSFAKKFGISFFYFMMLGAYHHLFPFLINDKVIYYAFILFLAAIVLFIVLAFIWLFDESDTNIFSQYSGGIKAASILSRLAFVCFFISIWIYESSKIGLENYSFFYSSKNILNVIAISAFLAMIIAALSKILSKFCDMTISKDIYYIKKYSDYEVVKISETNYLLLKNSLSEERIYIDFKKNMNLKIFNKKVTQPNKYNFIIIFVKLIIFLSILLMSFWSLVINILCKFANKLMSINEKAIKKQDLSHIRLYILKRMHTFVGKVLDFCHKKNDENGKLILIISRKYLNLSSCKIV